MDNIDDANERAATYLQARIDAVTKSHHCQRREMRRVRRRNSEARRRTVPGVRSASTAKSWKN